jgi:hypothetical protein
MPPLRYPALPRKSDGGNIGGGIARVEAAADGHKSSPALRVRCETDDWLDWSCASFETPASWAPQDEETLSMPSTITLMLRSARRARLEARIAAMQRYCRCSPQFCNGPETRERAI